MVAGWLLVAGSRARDAAVFKGRASITGEGRLVMQSPCLLSKEEFEQYKSINWTKKLARTDKAGAK
jgi:hypothetical protein